MKYYSASCDLTNIKPNFRKQTIEKIIAVQIVKDTTGWSPKIVHICDNKKMENDKNDF